MKLPAANGFYWVVNELNKIFDNADGEPIAGVNAVHGATSVKTVQLTLDDYSVTMTDATTAGSHGKIKIYDFPEGTVQILGATLGVAIARVGTALTATSAVVTALGSATVGTNDATLTTTEANIVPSTAATLTDGAGSAAGASTAALTLTGAPASAYLNFATPDAGSTGNDALLVNGTVTLTYVIVSN